MGGALQTISQTLSFLVQVVFEARVLPAAPGSACIIIQAGVLSSCVGGVSGVRSAQLMHFQIAAYYAKHARGELGGGADGDRELV